MLETPQNPALWPLVTYSILVTGLIGGMLCLSHYLGERHAGRARNAPFESGIVPSGPAQIRYSSHFYLVAMFFLIFDLEAVFLFSWAVAFYEVGWPGFFEATVFIAILAAALIYLWRLGVLDWGSALGRVAAHAKRL